MVGFSNNIGFDLDNTLISTELHPKLILPVFEILKQYFITNKNIFIITARPDFFLFQMLTNQQLKKFGIDKFIRYIFYTNGRSKIKLLKKLNICQFYDDNIININDIIRAYFDGYFENKIDIYKVNYNKNKKNTLITKVFY